MKTVLITLGLHVRFPHPKNGHTSDIYSFGVLHTDDDGAP